METGVDRGGRGSGLYRGGILQLGIVALAAAAAAAYLGAQATEGTSEDAERRAVLRSAQTDATELLLAVSDFALGGGAAARDIAVETRADLSARLDALARAWPERGDEIASAAAKVRVAGRFMEEAWRAGEDRSALRALGAQAEAIQKEVAALDASLLEAGDARLAEFAELCYAVLGGLVAIHVLVGVTFLMRQYRSERDWRGAVGGLEGSLGGIFQADGDAATRPIQLDPLLGQPLSSTVEELRQAHRHLIEIEREERQHARFAQELIEALELDDTPQHVYGTVERAVRLRMGDSPFRLLVADDSGASLEEQVSSGPALCDPPLPHRCPAIRKGRLVRFSEESGLARCPFLTGDENRVMCAPVASGGKAFAVAQLTWSDSRKAEDLSGDLVTLVGTLGTRLGVLRTLEEREVQAATDPLTGLANRRAMNKYLSELDARGERYAVICCDLDHFKKLNDVHGHDTGDKCLQLFARVLNEESRQGDLACRPGGEEFMLVVKGGDPNAALRVAKRIRVNLAQASELAGPAFTSSMGIACRPEHGEGWEQLLGVADRALYRAKEEGRDRAVMAGAERTPSPGAPRAEPVALPRAEVPESLDHEDEKEA